ncbi:helix-turn-helix domain-containing protein [Aurantimonas sp. E1-2-R+4]|uniref:helix-turn-helix domain-containing protein n=1 Tax=Aurantimonas sp. E1-2-R+4 TaxID=3113714 RepID=UPI002F93E128
MAIFASVACKNGLEAVRLRNRCLINIPYILISAESRTVDIRIQGEPPALILIGKERTMGADFTILTQVEAAKRLNCSPRVVARLRAAGKLTYIPGRPVRIVEADLVDYIERAAAEAEEKRKAKLPPEPGSPEARKAFEARMEARLRKVRVRRAMQRLRAERPV